LTIHRAVRTGAVFIRTPASDSSEGSNPEAKPVSGGQQWFLKKSGGQPWFESSVPGEISQIDDRNHLRSDMLTFFYNCSLRTLNGEICSSLVQTIS
jgi:hypothetical protein